MNKKIKFEELPKNEQDILGQIYGLQLGDSRGYNPQKIICVEELTDAEKPFFGECKFFCVFAIGNGVLTRSAIGLTQNF